MKRKLTPEEAMELVDLTEKIFEQLSSGFEPSAEDIRRAEELGADVQSIRKTVEDCYGDKSEEDSDS